MSIELPHKYGPRSYQLPFLQAMDEGCQRAVLVWHRRSGKDKTVLNFTITRMMERVGTYYYFFPTYAQAKKVLWTGIDRNGFKFMDHFPKELVYGKNETDMSVTLRHPTEPGRPGSVFQLIGSDKIDSVVGPNPVGCLFSEYALQMPRAWRLMEPILLENGGFAVFIYTPRGKNHGFNMYEMAKSEPKWFSSLKTIEDTRRDAPGEDGSRVITDEQISEIRRSGTDEETIQQEYYCSFSGSMQGAYYTSSLDIAYADGRIGDHVLHDPSRPVETWWDLGLDDATAVGFVQQHKGSLRLIDYMEDRNKGLDWWAAQVRGRGYVFSGHVAPHDINVREMTSGRSRIEVAAKLGLRFRVAPKLALQDGILATRLLFPRFQINSARCARLLDCLANYRRVFDDDLQEFRKEPVHDQFSHGADMVRTGAVGFRDIGFDDQEQSRQQYAETDFNPFTYAQDHRGEHTSGGREIVVDRGEDYILGR